MAADIDLKSRQKRALKFASGPPKVDPKKCYLNQGDEDQMEVEGYVVSPVWRGMVYVGVVLTVGLLQLLFHWLPHWLLRATHRKCSLAEATTLLLRDQYEQWFVVKIHTITKDGTRVAVLTPSASFNLSGRTKRKQAQLLLNTGQRDENLVRYFEIKRVKYIWNPDEDKYQKLSGLEADSTCSYFHESRGLTYDHQRKRRVLYGSNAIDVHVSPIVKLLFKEALTPFYVFQVFSTCVWFSDEYYYYASCIIIISVLSLSTSIYQTRKMERALRNTIQTSTIVTVCRGEDIYEDIPSEDLVPGDVIEIPNHGGIMQCDAVLISGNCIVNESMLTGESVPVTKTPLPDSRKDRDVKFNMKDHARHILFCGTQVIQTRYYGNHRVRAVVLRTGFLTSKGELVRAILFPKPVDFKFNRDTYLFVAVLFSIAAVGLIYTLVLKIKLDHPVHEIIKRSLDVITIAVPPALPAALTVGIVFAQARMKKREIYCISPRSINICGSINAVCFDKTGTLTEEGLDMMGVVPVKSGSFTEEVTNVQLLPSKDLVVEAMATCHSLTLIEGQLRGDPLDLIMFQSIGWVLEEAGEESSRFDMLVPTIVYPQSSRERLMSAEELTNIAQPGSEIGIVRQFTFTSSVQRMSVITRRLAGTQFEVFCKGSPEVISSLCKPDTVPADFHRIMMTYTRYGYRVLALAWKQLPNKYNYVKVQRIQRDAVEKELTFLGLLVMENKLKPETTPVIEQLIGANIRTIMVTGDNMLTALSVAHDCKMVADSDRVVLVEAQIVDTPDGQEPQCSFQYEESTGTRHSLSSLEHMEKETGISEVHISVDGGSSRVRFAMTGRSWEVLRQHFPDILHKLVVRGVVFARMSPDQKAQLVECLQDLGYYVAMCGDGANDCGALKMAHTGISLSEAEASVASPFTSKQPNIMCVPTVIREGRAALVTSFGIFKYMACYSLTQFVSVILLYHVNSNLTDFEFLYIDLALLLTLSVTYGRTEAYPTLVRDPPQLSLTSPAPILSIILQMVIQISAQVFIFFHVQQQPWVVGDQCENRYEDNNRFTPHEMEEDRDFKCFQNAAVFSVSVFQYIILAVAFSKGAPYRKPIYTNYLFVANLLACVGFSAFLTIYPPSWMQNFFELESPPVVTYRLLFLGVAAVNCFLSVLLETFLLDHEVFRRKFNALRERCCPGLKYEYCQIEEEIVATPSWPPVGLHPITAAYRQQGTFSHEIDAKETDQMLPCSADMNNCSESVYGSSSAGYTPRASTDRPFISRASIGSLSSETTDYLDASDLQESGQCDHDNSRHLSDNLDVFTDTNVSLCDIPEEQNKEYHAS
ncbi:polyamine-transporting ATPase 13A3-like isoform X2 [Dreissena polymorpha]|uniref:polyamine-transporting ATPase 13A3-like isoform X2 n=1 Tax=Dreissena polymorpha TaxID=45954 RepID=UPI0022650BE2|nr:polyamine-transporting ATPase 13A3-like isoform X2 [Dreissena polymorpha]